MIPQGEGRLQMKPENWPGPSVPSYMISNKSGQILDSIFKQGPKRYIYIFIFKIECARGVNDTIIFCSILNGP